MSIYTYYLFIYFFIFYACSRLAFSQAPVLLCLGGWAYRCITLIFMGERLYYMSTYKVSQCFPIVKPIEVQILTRSVKNGISRPDSFGVGGAFVLCVE